MMGLTNTTFYIETFDVNIKRDICSAMCINRSGRLDICSECFGLTEETSLC